MGFLWDGRCCPKCGSPHTERYPNRNWCADCGHSWNRMIWDRKKGWFKPEPKVDVSESGKVSVDWKEE